MQTRVLRRLHPRGTTGRFGAFEVTVFNAVLWPGIDRLGRSERATERQRPTVYALLDQPQDAWIFSGIPSFDPITARAAVDALAQSFRANVRGGAIDVDQPARIPFGVVFTHELWPAISVHSERRVLPPDPPRPDQPQAGFQWNFWPAMDVQGGSFRPPTPPTQLRLDQPESGFQFGATYSHELWPGVETRADRVPVRASRWIVDPIDVGWLFPILGAFDPITARGALDLLLASFRVDPRSLWRVVDQPSFTQDFPFDAQFTTASLQALATSYRMDPRTTWRVVDEPLETWKTHAFLSLAARAALDFLSSSYRVDARPSWSVAGWPHDAWIHQVFIARAARAAFDGLTASFRVDPRSSWRVADLPMWSQNIVSTFDAAFWPAIGQLLQWERQTRISHVWDTRRFPGRKLAGGPESAAQPAFDPTTVWAAYEFLAASFRTGKRPDARQKDYKFPFGLLDARMVMPAIHLLLEAFQSRKRVPFPIPDQPFFAQLFPFDPMFTVASTQGLRASFRSAPRPSWRVWDTPADAWMFSAPSTFELAFLSAIRFLMESYRAGARSSWREGEMADTAWTWLRDPGLLRAAIQGLLDVYRMATRQDWRVTEQPSDAWLASPFNPLLWPAIEPKETTLDLRRRIWFPTEQPSFTQQFAFDPQFVTASTEGLLASFRSEQRRIWLPTSQPSFTQDFPFDPQFIVASVHALLASFRADPRHVWLPTEEPPPAWIFENIPPIPTFPWAVLGEWLRARPSIPMEPAHMAEPGFPRPLFPRKPTPRRRKPC